MNAYGELGLQRGSADKLAGRPFDDAPPASVDGSRAGVSGYKQGYKRGYGKTKPLKKGVAASTGASYAGISYNAEASVSTSPAPGSEGNADQGFSAPLPADKPPVMLSASALKGLQQLTTKPKISVATKQAASPFGGAPSSAPPAPVPMQTMPGTNANIVPGTTGPGPEAMPPAAMVLSKSDMVVSWLKDHWQYLAIGAGVVAVGTTIFIVAHRKTSQHPT